METNYATDIRIFRKGDDGRRPASSYSTTRKLSDAELESVITDCWIGLDKSKYEITTKR